MQNFITDFLQNKQHFFCVSCNKSRRRYNHLMPLWVGCEVYRSSVVCLLTRSRVKWQIAIWVDMWNSLPEQPRQPDITFGQFKRSLKTLCLVSWWSGVVVSTLALINEVNLRRTRLELRWVTVSGSVPGAGHLFQYVTNQPPKANSALHPSGVGKWVPASAVKAKAGMVHSISGWTRGVQVKLWDPSRTRAIPEHLRGAFTTRRYTNPRLPLPLP